MGPIKEALTFDDVLLTPNYSNILPSEVSTSTSLSSNINLKIPVLLQEEVALLLEKDFFLQEKVGFYKKK